MVITKFYDIINEELAAILAANGSDARLQQHHDIAQNKSYALLVWFLKFYGQKDLYKSYITDGDGDRGCDIIFSNKNTQEETIFYVVQSKFINLSKNETGQYIKKSKGKDLVIDETTFPKIDKEEFGATLNSFSAMLSGELKPTKNKEFNKRYEELKKHLADNGKVKFLFFTLANTNDEVEESVLAFNKNYAPNISFEVIDIERIRRDYIEFKYKEISTSNPLEYNYSSEDSTIELPIERFKESKRDIFEFVGRTKAFTVLLKPKTVYDLFKKYRFSLFFKNVRNPIHRSNYNQKIIDTLLKKPDSFWYFNNGITGITKILPDVGIHATKIELEGLQIINGAQTVYSIYSAYENATAIQRKAMDAYAKVAIRLIGSSDEEFNLQITRYTNMQNPMHDRDFWANDDIQQQLQNESFATNYWYEKRRDEFQLSETQQEELGITIVPNSEFVKAYVSFYLQKPIYAFLREDDFFISRKDDKKGLYEEIFDGNNVKFEDMYASVFISNFVYDVVGYNFDAFSFNFSAPILALSKIVLIKYFSKKFNINANATKAFNLSRHILNIAKYEKEEEMTELNKILYYTTRIIFQEMKHEDKDKHHDRWVKFYSNETSYYVLAEKIQEEDLDIAAIQAIDLEEHEIN